MWKVSKSVGCGHLVYVTAVVGLYTDVQHDVKCADGLNISGLYIKTLHKMCSIFLILSYKFRKAYTCSHEKYIQLTAPFRCSILVIFYNYTHFFLMQHLQIGPPLTVRDLGQCLLIKNISTVADSQHVRALPTFSRIFFWSRRSVQHPPLRSSWC